jgi:menaquinone-dependent protoporphyrinogen IX oxidase
MKVLLTFSSGYGTTKEVAEEIANVFQNEYQLQVDLQPIDDMARLSDYDVIVVGSSVRADNPLANTSDFFALHNKELLKKKFALFMVCLTAGTAEGKIKVKRDYLSKILLKYPALSPIGVEAFGGRIDFAKLNPVMQQLVKTVMRKAGVCPDASLDARNWDEIRQWARVLAEKINSPW